MVLEDAYPNFSICGIPYYVSGEVTHWRNLAHRTVADLEAAGMRAAAGHHRPAHRRARPQAPGHLHRRRGGTAQLRQALVGTGAVPVRPPISGLAGPGALGPDDGLHLLHSMGDTFAVMATLEQAAPGQRGHRRRRVHRPGDGRRPYRPRAPVTQMEQLPEVLPTVDPELGALVNAELAGHGVEVLTGTTVQAISKRPARRIRAAARPGHRG